MRFVITNTILLVVLLMLGGCFPGRSVVVLLPDDEGNVGEIRVQSGNQVVVMDEAYHSITTGSLFASQSPQEVTKSEVATSYEAAMSEEPQQHFRFVKRTFYFKYDSDTFTASSKKNLSQVVQLLRKKPPLEIYVVGHADRTGTEQYNQHLSYLRASRVRQILLEEGVAGKIITISYLGETMPAVKTPDEVAEPMNRRAVLVLKYIKKK